MSVSSSPEPVLWKVADVMRACRVDRHRARALMHEAGLVKLDARLRVRPEDIAALLARRREPRHDDA